MRKGSKGRRKVIAWLTADGTLKGAACDFSIEGKREVRTEFHRAVAIEVARLEARVDYLEAVNMRLTKEASADIV